MDVSEVLDKGFIAHANVKNRLKKIIAGEEQAEPESVRADNKCIVGEWIYGPGVSCKDIQEYTDLKDIHAQFHEEAYNALRLNMQGKSSEASEYVDSGPFEEQSKKIKIALFNMKKVLEKK